MINSENVTFAYGDNVIFSDFSLKVNDGERVYLHAASGKGKTTLLRLILGLEKPLKGAVHTSGESFAVSFQEDRLLPFRTVRDNIMLFSGKTEDEVSDICGDLGIGDAMDKYPSQLSGGMARRVSIARALAKGGDAFIFDEPFNGLDEDNIVKAAGAIEKYTKGKTLIAVIHKKEDAERLGLAEINL